MNYFFICYAQGFRNPDKGIQCHYCYAATESHKVSRARWSWIYSDQVWQLLVFKPEAQEIWSLPLHSRVLCSVKFGSPNKRFFLVSDVQNLSGWINTNISGKKLNCTFWRLPSDGETELLKEAAEFTLLQAFKAQLDKATINMTPCWWQSHFDWEVRLGTIISTLPTTTNRV